MSDFIEISDDGENWERVKTVPADPRPRFIRAGTTTKPKAVEPTPEPEPVENLAPVIGTCAVCGGDIRESDARIETEGGALAHAEHPLTVKQQDALDA